MLVTKINFYKLHCRFLWKPLNRIATSLTHLHFLVKRHRRCISYPRSTPASDPSDRTPTRSSSITTTTCGSLISSSCKAFHFTLHMFCTGFCRWYTLTHVYDFLRLVSSYSKLRCSLKEVSTNSLFKQTSNIPCMPKCRSRILKDCLFQKSFVV